MLVVAGGSKEPNGRGGRRMGRELLLMGRVGGCNVNVCVGGFLIWDSC